MVTLSLTLDRLHPNKSGIIESLAWLDAKAQRRYAAMGLLEGTAVTVLYTAPSGDPIAIRVRGYTLSLRRSDAKKILLSTAKPTSSRSAE